MNAKGTKGTKGAKAAKAGGGQGERGGVTPEIRDLILALADSKRLLGYRYAEWMLGAPELETGIALSSMAQDEWGHARLLYALLKDSEDVDALEHGREPGEYRNLEVLDSAPATWADTVALMVVVDAAISVQLDALRASAYEPLRQRVEKLLEEERFHAAHGAAWVHRLAKGTEASAAAIRGAIESVLAPALRWFGAEDGRGAALAEEGVVDASPDALRARLLERIGPLLGEVGVTAPAPGSLGFDGFDETRRRTGGGGPDAGTIERVRGDRNRAFLMD